MVVLTDGPELPAGPLPPQVDVALDPIIARRSSAAADAEVTSTHEAPVADSAEAPAADADQAKKTYRVDPPRSEAVDAPHFAAAPAAPATEQPAGNPLPAVEVRAMPRAELSADEMASLIGAPPTDRSPAAESLPPEPAAPVAPLVPMWEVDRFQWPAICDRLLKDDRSYFAQAGGKLVAAAKDGLRTLGITGSRRGEGRSTLALCLARCAAQSGLNVAMIDADFTRPQLAAVIGLEVAYGWQDAAQGKIPLAEAAVKSLADRITVLPLEPSSVAWPLALADKRVSAIIRAVAQSHDLVIIDLGPLPGGGDPIFASDEPAPLDAAIVLRDLRYATPAETKAIGERLHASGVEAIGIAENFVPAQQASVA
jgi:Mrp family chromosome partitioning ATPase